MCEIKNLTELLVRKALDEYMEHNELPCKCEKCRADIITYALNRLPPKYFSTRRGEIIKNAESQLLYDKTRILTELVAGITLVAANPAHER
ncbi:Late competence development protein ComFB [Syntrophobotulus glycolicus DSM 8271]|uniref:Late competence development protein ComFB n=1 Tax=Syntrophobotulus glycolicus (strain DSM 8271 / FlGlyR) TaxID=645991 RepID=F0T2R8_SYNGF|nr:late competence development ComFB family protein [Syntrophobotulus glycolicus]ADY56467.1 Late competence development protein ComFB [Syntrophobotulus glycolicus DSM 8271]